MLGWTLAATVVAGLTLVGLAGAVAPQAAARQYGIVLDDPRAEAFVRGMAVRDLAIAALLGLIALERARTTLGWGMLATATIAVADLALVVADRRAQSRRPIERAAGLHATGTLVLLLAGVALLAGR